MFACLSGMYKYLGWIKLQCYCVHVNLFKLNAFSLVFSTRSSLAECWPYLCTNGSFYLGSLDTTRVLLEAGAKVNAENNLGRTAAQLGAFVGMRKLYLPCSTVSNDAVVLCYIVCKRMKQVVQKLKSQDYVFFTPAGQTDCVSLINNFLAVEDLEYYTKPQG